VFFSYNLIYLNMLGTINMPMKLAVPKDSTIRGYPQAAREAIL